MQEDIEKGKVSIGGGSMENVRIQVLHDKLIVRDMPRLVIDLNGRKNDIETEQQKIPYRKSIRVSKDLLQGKRANVMQTVMMYYYWQASHIAEGYERQADYRENIIRGNEEKVADNTRN